MEQNDEKNQTFKNNKLISNATHVPFLHWKLTEKYTPFFFRLVKKKIRGSELKIYKYENE